MPTMPHGYTNRVTWDGLVVTKSYQGPAAQARRDRDHLAGQAGRNFGIDELGRIGLDLRRAGRCFIHGAILAERQTLRTAPVGRGLSGPVPS